MTTRAMGPGAGLGWLKQAVNLGRNNPKAIFGGAALLLGVLVLLAIGIVALMTALQAIFKPGPTGSMALAFLVVMPLILVMAAMMVGYLRLIDAVENGRPARATDVLAAFRDVTVSLRAIGFMILLTIAQNVLVVALVGLLAKDVGSWYLQNMQTSMTGGTQAPMTSLPEGFGIAFAVILVIGLFCYAVQAIGLAQIALRDRNVFGAIADGVAGTAKNLLPLLVMTLLIVLAAIVLVLLIVLLGLLIGLLAKVVGAWLGVLLAVPLYIGGVIVMYVVMFGVMYHLWRDVCGDDAPRNDAVSL